MCLVYLVLLYEAPLSFLTLTTEPKGKINLLSVTCRGRSQLFFLFQLSDRVIKRMRQPPEVVSPPLAPESKTPTASPLPDPSVEHLLPLPTPPPPPVITTPPPSPPPPQGATVPTVEPAPGVQLIPPPPVRFHSFPPSSADPAAPPSPSPTPSPGIEAAVEPLPPPPVVPPSAETLILPTSVESSQASLASPEPSSQTPPTAPVTPSIELLESAAPSYPPVETVQLPPSAESTPAEPVSPVRVEAPAVDPAVAPESPCDLHQSPPPPEYAAAPPSPLSPLLSFEETSPSCQCVELTLAPTDPPLAPPSPTEELPEIPPLPPVDEKEAPVVITPPPPAAGEFAPSWFLQLAE